MMQVGLRLVLWGSSESIGRLNVLSLLLPSCEWDLSFLSLSPRIMQWYSSSATPGLVRTKEGLLPSPPTS